MSLQVGQEVYVGYGSWGRRFSAIIRRIQGGVYYMEWVNSGLEITAPRHMLTPISALEQLAKAAE